jgi:hypothetical protein
LDAGAAFAAGLGAAAGFLSAAAALIAPAPPRSTPSINTAEPLLIFLLTNCMIMGSLIPVSDRLELQAFKPYSTLLTLPFVKVTFISL